jgi:DGQHR domain-containing protein
LRLHDEPRIYLTVLPGKWLLAHTTSTTSWRLKDAALGFQRVVSEERAEAIAKDVIENGRAFPSAIVLATKTKELVEENGDLVLPSGIKFLVVDGQHRLWAQHSTKVEAAYPVVLHLGLSEKSMAYLFLDINDNQKRVPSSLRWDLYRLVHPEDDPFKVTASEIVFDLIDREGTALYQRVDRTGEQKALKLKLGSIAPEIHTLIANRQLPLRSAAFEDQVLVFELFFAAVRDMDPDGWKNSSSMWYKARILRASLRILGDILRREKTKPKELGVADYTTYLERVNPSHLTDEKLRWAQGAAGVKAIYETMKKDVFSGK